MRLKSKMVFKLVGKSSPIRLNTDTISANNITDYTLKRNWLITDGKQLEFRMNLSLIGKTIS